MKNKFFLFCITFLIFCFITKSSAQEKDKGSIVKLKSGLSVIFRSETDPPSNGQQDIGTYQVAGKNNVIHRAFLDAERGVYFGYDVEIEVLADSNQFRLIFKPLSSITYISVSKTVTTNSAGKQPQTTNNSVVLSPAKLLKYPEPQTVNDKDTVAFDVLFNQQTGVKIVDFIKILASDKQPNETSEIEKADLQRQKSVDVIKKRAADFTIDAVELNLTSAHLSVNGKISGKDNETDNINLRGPLLWFYLPGHGRFILSLSPHAGYEFQKLGTISNNKISFTFAGNRYEWVSTSPVLAAGNRSWNLWVLAEPNYRPERSKSEKLPYLFGSTDSLKSIFK